MKTEQRKHPRYRVKEEVMLIHDGNVGQLHDLSMGGCSCKCLVTENVFNNPTKISIFYTHRGEKFNLKNIPFAIAHNCTDNISPFTCSITKKCGIKFGDISSLQKEKIELLISQCGKM